MNDDYSNHPVSITEATADKTGDALKWTPRDALINALRRIDSGDVKATKLIIIWDEERSIGYNQAGCGGFETVGMLQTISHRIIEDS